MSNGSALFMSVNKGSVVNNEIVEWVSVLFDIPDKELE